MRLSSRKSAVAMFAPAMLAALCAAPPACAESPFAEAIEYAQARCAKIYGGSIGREPGYATGLVISGDGQILTAQGIYLVGERIRVVLPDGSEHRAQVERRSEPLQAAVLKIDAETPHYFELPSETVGKKGDWVVGVSNAFKVAGGTESLSVNLGVISLRTTLEAKRGVQDVPYEGEILLIDAITSNPGAPGGALITADGRLAGMIGKIIEGKNTNTRLNYAVPADLLHKFVSGQLLASSPKESTSEKADVGIRVFTLGGKNAPAFIDRVLPGSPAAEAGLRPDDLILAVGSQTVRSVREYQEVAKTFVVGEKIDLVIKRRNELMRVTLDASKP